MHLAIFVGLLLYAWTKVAKVRKTDAYKDRLLPFTYFSFAAWIVWGLQSVILLPSPLVFPTGSFLNNAGLWLGLMQNALWFSAVLSLYPEQLTKKSLSIPVLLMFPIVIASVTSRTALLTSETVAWIDTFAAVVIFTAFVLWILKWHLRTIFVAAFFIHGCFQWLLRSLWFTPFTERQIALLLSLPLWRGLLLFAWAKLISEMVDRAEASLREVVAEIEKQKLVDPLDPFYVMIASTVEDLKRERDAAEGAIVAMHLGRFRAEHLGSVALSARELCELMAKKCDICLLIIGERYGHIMEPEGISVVEFEFRTARDVDRGKILVYVKDGVKREDERLIKFLESLQEFTHGRVTWSFSTPEKLAEQIPPDIMRWLTSNAKQNKQKKDRLSPIP